MGDAFNLILIDGDVRRRAAISHTLSSGRIHVEPFETIAEIAASWPRAGIILIHDDPGVITKLVGQMGRGGEWFPIIAFSEAPSASQVVEAILAGAVDYINWPFDAPELLAALERTETRARGLGSARLRESIARSRIEKLTGREREVLGCVANGMSNRKIGERLSISPRTVEIHRANMLNKLGANHTSEAIRIAIEAELAT